MLTAELIDTHRLRLAPLRSADANEMFGVLDDERLHTFTGGRPRTASELRAQYRKLACGISPDGREVWLNWIVRLQEGGAAIGTVQAGVVGSEADVAWVIGFQWQGCGYASEAACRMVSWLRAHGVTLITAAIHPDHVTSQAVARRIGLTRTDTQQEGEDVWRDGDGD